MREILRLVGLACIAMAIASIASAQNQFDLNEQTFNSWLYGNSQGRDIASALAAEIEGIDRICKLTPAQRNKLKLAGRGDEVRFSERVDELRTRLVGKSYDQNKINEIYQEIQPLAMEYRAGVLGKSSLFYKVLHRTLDPQQQKEFQRIQAERRQARHEARIRLFIVQLERSCPLTDEQRTNLMDVFLKETRPAETINEYEQYVLLYYAAKVPEEKFADFLDEAQRKVLMMHLQQGRGMEQFLRQQGMLPEDDVDVDD